MSFYEFGRQLPREPRWINHFYAWIVGFYWLPCGICGQNYGGHEFGKSVINYSNGVGQSTCYKH